MKTWGTQKPKLKFGGDSSFYRSILRCINNLPHKSLEQWAPVMHLRIWFYWQNFYWDIIHNRHVHCEKWDITNLRSAISISTTSCFTFPWFSKLIGTPSAPLIYRWERIRFNIGNQVLNAESSLALIFLVKIIKKRDSYYSSFQ